MKCIYRLMLTLITSVISASPMLAQEKLTIEVEKPGKLSKHIKKEQYPQIKSLTVEGTLNNSDVLILSQLDNLKELNLSRTKFESGDYHPEKRPFIKDYRYEGRIVHLPSLSTLRKLTIPTNYWSVDVSNLPNLKVVEMFGGPSMIGLSHSLDTLKINQETLAGLLMENRELSKRKRFSAKTRVLLYDGELYSWDQMPEQLEVNVYVFSNAVALKSWSPEITPEELSSVSLILSVAYSNYPEETLTLPNGVKTIWSRAFENPRLKHINLSNVETIKSHAFDGCTNLTELIIPESVKSIGEEAFNNSGIKSITLPSAIEKINGKAFVGLNSVEFSGIYPPEISDSYIKFDGIIYVPEGRLDAYNIGSYKNASILEKGKGKEYVFNVVKPGTLSQFITDTNAGDIISLKITGKLYDTDFDAIYKCKNLRDLDLSHCFIMESYETAKRKRDEDAALLGMLSAVASMANANETSKLRAGRGNVSDVAYTEAASELFGKALKEFESGEITPSDQCVFPDDVFKDGQNPYLSKIVFPIHMKKVPFVYNANRLTEITLPPSAEEIPYRAFQFAKISSVFFPPTLRVLGKESFIGSKLEEVDLSHTQIEELVSTFESCDNLKTFKGSPKLTKLYGSIGKNDVTGYFYTREKPEGLRYSSFKTIHIPRGSKAGWPKSGSDKVNIIDDIEL